MITIEDGRKNVAFDVDDTLILWDNPGKGISMEILCPYMKQHFKVWPHQRHIIFLKRQKAMGNKIFVWSRNGAKWAETVVKALGIQQHVDYCVGKMDKHVDDNPADVAGTPLYLTTEGRSV